MNNMRRNAMALLACAGIIIIAALLLSYGRRNEVSAILTFGYVLDALVTTGFVGNLIVFLLAKTTRLNPLRLALGTFAVVHAVPLLFLVLVGRNDPRFNLNRVVAGYVVSFLFWTAMHWTWQKTVSSSRRQEQV
jgi:Na+/proline symporter